MKNMSEIEIELQDTEWEASYIDHDRLIARAVVFDDEGYYYFVRAERDDDFGKAVLIETSGGGVESGEELEIAVKRELGEELGADVDNQIHRHNISHYFLCRVRSFNERHLTNEETEDFNLSTLKLTYEAALKEYEKCSNTKIGRLIANRELPVIMRAREIIMN